MFNEKLDDVVARIEKAYDNDVLDFNNTRRHFPNKRIVFEIIKELRRVMFPRFFGSETPCGAGPKYFIGNTLSLIEENLHKQVCEALLFGYKDTRTLEEVEVETSSICSDFFYKLPDIQGMLLKDVDAAFDGDPAAGSKEEIIYCYPGFFAIFVYRLAHELALKNVPLIPRIMSEYAHEKTGVDIGARAEIGEYFFIDHAAGVVIGETTKIGNNVKIYQGVTLGALSTRGGQKLAGVKRHPTIEDNVTIYSNASVLGGETVIGEGSVISGSAFVIESVPPNSRVSVKNQEVCVRAPKTEKKSGEYNWEV